MSLSENNNSDDELDEIEQLKESIKRRRLLSRNEYDDKDLMTKEERQALLKDEIDSFESDYQEIILTETNEIKDFIKNE